MPAPRTLDELCLGLGRMRANAGSPSYAEIARRIGGLRDGAEPPKVTVYDCFRPGGGDSMNAWSATSCSPSAVTMPKPASGGRTRVSSTVRERVCTSR
ncbi:hypothetical protein LJR042_001930 [Microbacterium maritypicum]|uniref:hypothetical protein n=1 Tax=Microbacterium maritypicum TaxID=33918 RepID=UPI003ECDDD92